VGIRATKYADRSDQYRSSNQKNAGCERDGYRAWKRVDSVARSRYLIKAETGEQGPKQDQWHRR
jgi:hypothetical protein